MEKKDLDTYLRLRIRILRQKHPEQEARINELSLLGNALHSNSIKVKCKKMWEYLNSPAKQKTGEFFKNMQRLKERKAGLVTVVEDIEEVQATTPVPVPAPAPAPVNLFKSDRVVPTNLFKRDDQNIVESTCIKYKTANVEESI